MSEPQPQIKAVTISSLLSLLPRRQILTGVLRDILTRHFQEGAIEDPALSHLTWNAGEDTKIMIDSLYRWRPELTERRPAVIIKANGCKNERLGIEDRQMPGDGFGHEHYASFWIGSHTLFCLGREGAQADLLAEEVKRQLQQFHPVIRRMLCLHKFSVVEVGEAAKVEESSENWAVPVNVGWAYEDRWVIRQEAPVLRGVSLSYILEK